MKAVGTGWQGPAYDLRVWGFGGRALFGLTPSLSSTRRRCEHIGAVSKHANELDSGTLGP